MRVNGKYTADEVTFRRFEIPKQNQNSQYTSRTMVYRTPEYWEEVVDGKVVNNSYLAEFGLDVNCEEGIISIPEDSSVKMVLKSEEEINLLLKKAQELYRKEYDFGKVNNLTMLTGNYRSDHIPVLKEHRNKNIEYIPLQYDECDTLETKKLIDMGAVFIQKDGKLKMTLINRKKENIDFTPWLEYLPMEKRVAYLKEREKDICGTYEIKTKKHIQKINVEKITDEKLCLVYNVGEDEKIHVLPNERVVKFMLDRLKEGYKKKEEFELSKAVRDLIQSEEISTYEKPKRERMERTMKYEVKINDKKDQSGPVKAYATVVFNGDFRVGNIALVERKTDKQLYVSYPQRKSSEVTAEGKPIYKDICFPTTAEFKKELEENILAAANGDHSLTVEKENAEIEVKVNLIKNSQNNVKAMATLNIGNSFAVTGIKVAENQQGQKYVSMPNHDSGRKDEAGKKIYDDYCNPITKECREKVNKLVLEGYEKEVAVRDQPNKAAER